jgi:hypothetical protein
LEKSTKDKDNQIFFIEGYRLIENHNCIDRLSFHYGHKYEDTINSPFRYALKISKNEDSTEVQTPGFFTKDNCFHEAPLQFDFFELLNITIYEKSKYDDIRLVEVTFRLHDINFQNSRLFHAKINERPYAGRFFWPADFIKVLNKSVIKGIVLNDINDDLLEKHYYSATDLETAIDIFTDLKNNVSSKSMNRVGKDTMYWQECEMYNLPKEKYMYDLLIKCLNENFRVETKSDHLTLKMYDEYVEFKYLLNKTLIAFSKTYDKIDRFIANVSSH